MIKLRVEEFHPGHILKDFTLRPDDPGRLINTDIKLFLKSVKGSPAYSHFYKDTVIFCGGVKIYCQGFGEAWLLCSERVEGFKGQLVVQARECLDRIILESRLHRVQATPRDDWPRSYYRFLEKLGFEKEGLMRNYGFDCADHIMYARIESCQIHL